MLIVTLAVLLCAALCVVIVLALTLIRRQPAKPETADTGPAMRALDPAVSGEIEAAAWTWAVANGRPELAGLLARKVKQAWEIQESRIARVRKGEQS